MANKENEMDKLLAVDDAYEASRKGADEAYEVLKAKLMTQNEAHEAMLKAYKEARGLT